MLIPTEIEQILSFGINQFNFFPSEASGGVSKLEVVSAPYAHLGIKFIPSGGININNLEEYLVLNQVLAVGGTWIAEKEIISAQKWDRITKNAAAAAELHYKYVKASIDICI